MRSASVTYLVRGLIAAALVLLAGTPAVAVRCHSDQPFSDDGVPGDHAWRAA